jgi:hypothetical protein
LVQFSKEIFEVPSCLIFRVFKDRCARRPEHLVLLPRRVAVLYPEPPAVLLAVVFRLLQLEKNTFVVSGVLYRKLSH